MIKSGTLFILLSALLISQSHAQPSQPQADTAVRYLSARQCTDYATKNNLQVKNALINIQVQEQTNRGITSAALPQISAEGNLTHYPQVPVQLIPGEFFGQPGKRIPVSFLTKWTGTASVSLRQILFDGQVFVGLQARRASIELQQRNYEITEQSIRSNIYKIYYQLAAGKTQLGLIDANLDRARVFVKDAGALYRNGFAEKLDADRAQVQLSNLETQRLQVINQLENGYIGLKYLMGMPVQTRLVLTDSVTEAMVKEGAVALSDTGNYSYESRPEYASALKGRELNEYNVKRYRYAALPQLSLNSAYQRQWFADKFTPTRNEWFPTFLVGLNLNVPIFSGYRRQADLSGARMQLNQINNQIADLENSIDNEVLQARNTFRNSLLTLDNQRQNMQLAEQVYNTTKKKFESGLAGNIEVTNTQADLITAQNNYTNALYSAIVARIDFLKATGNLPD